MADLKLVGAVAIKVRPDAKGFRKDTQDQIRQELRDVKAEVDVEAKLDSAEVRSDAKKLEKDLEGKAFTWHIKLDHDSVRDAQKRLNSLTLPTQKVEFKLGDQASINQARKDLEDLAKKAKVRITYSKDEQGYQEVLAKIAAIRRQKIEKTINFKTGKASLDKLEAEMRTKIAALGGGDVVINARSTIKFEYDENRESLEATLAEIDRELAKFKDQSIYVEADKDSLLAARAAVKAAVDDLPVKFEYDEDKAGLKKAIDAIDAELAKVRTKLSIEATLDEESLLAARAKLVADMKDLRETIEISYSSNRASLEKVLTEIDSAMAEIDKVTIEVGVNPLELAFARANVEAALAKIPVSFKYNKNLAGLEKAIAEIDAQIATIKQAEIKSELDIPSLLKARARLEEEMSELTVRFEYDESLASLTAIKAKIEALLHIEKLAIVTKLDETSLREALAKADALIAAHKEASIKPKVEPHIVARDYIKVTTALALLSKSQTVDILVKLNNASVFLAAAKLTGLRAASRWTEGFTRTLGSLDRNLPIVTAAVLGINTLTSGFFSLTASAFSLGNELGTVVRMATLMAPAMILGFAAVKTVMTGVFKDFGAAVNGDKKAIEKLTESGKAAAANMRVIFQDIRETVSKNFWAEASDNMLRFTETALPPVREGMAKLATSMGGVFASVVEAASQFAEQNGFSVFFTNLVRGFDKVKAGMAPFMSAFLNLAALGSSVFPRMGAAFDVMSQKFDAWVKGLAIDGSFSRWVDRGVQGIKDLFSAGVSLVGVWKNIGNAAAGAGALTLSSFSALMNRLEDVTSGYRFQTNLSRIFRGAREASDELHTALGKLAPAMDTFSVTMGRALANSGRALAAFVGVLGDVLSSDNLDKGLTAFLSGVKRMFEELRPAAAPISEIIRTLGEVLGAVATDSGPLFRTLFTQLASVFTVAWHALEPFLPVLIQIGTTILNVLGPALAEVAGNFIPAFAGGLADLGDGLIPVIKYLADFAVGVSNMVADVPLPIIAGLVAGVLALNGAFQFATTILPLVRVAIEAFGIQAGVAAARAQLLIPVVGIALAAATAIAVGAVGALATGMESGTPYANEYATALREDAKAADEMGNAVGAATTKLAIQKLQQSGAYDAARKLGVGTWEVTEAVTKGGAAWDKLQDKISTAKKTYQTTFDAAAKLARGQQGNFGLGPGQSSLTPEMLEQKDAAELLGGALDNNRGSMEAARHENEVLAEAYKAAGIEGEFAAKRVDYLTEALKKQKSNVGAAAQATGALTDAFSSSSAKVDAMRKTFDILLGKDAGLAAAETLGAYVSGFNSLKESVTPLAGEMQNLGEAVYGDNGFLNVGGGNKAVLQVNQALVDEVNNVWAGAKAAYDAAIKQGFNAQSAFEKSQEFINNHKGDYNALAEASGLSADRVQGQWDAVFGHEWVLKVTLNGATEAATRAQELITALGGSFDGKEFVAYLDANPDKAMLAIQDPVAAATAFVNHKWMAQLEALPDAAVTELRKLTGLTEEEWNKGDFQAILTAADHIPGLQEALVQIMNGASNNGSNWPAIIKAIVDGTSVAVAEAALAALAVTRKAWIEAHVVQVGEIPQGNGIRSITDANGGIQDRFGRGLFGFNPGVKYFANGGFENHVAQIARPGVVPRVWAEQETHGEAYLPLAASKRSRSVAILKQVANMFGYQVSKSQGYANGGTTGPVSNRTTSANVTIHNLNTNDPDGAVRKLRQAQRDALAVHGITEGA